MSVIAEGTDPLDLHRPSLRERKKLATRRSIRRVALGLIAERGYAHVTVEDIAEAADISPRTFFNYFPSKEAALFGADNERTEALRQRLLDQPSEVSPLEALRATLVAEACLSPRSSASWAAILERLGTEADHDPYPLLLVSALMGVMRAVVMIWAGIGGAVTLERLIDAAFQSLAEGFQEQCELRSIVADAIGTGRN